MRGTPKLGTAAMICGCLLLAYGFWVWPTPWRSWSLRKAYVSHYNDNHIHHHTLHFRTSRLDGHMESVYTGMFGFSDCHPVTMTELQADEGPLTAAQIKNARQQW